MKRLITVLLLLFVFAKSDCFGQSLLVLPKKYFVKLDPASAIFNEFRMTYDRRLVINRRERVKDRVRLTDGNFLFFSPFVLHKKILGRHASPDTLSERQTGIGIRAGIRHFLFSEKTADGFFVKLGVLYRLRKIKFLGSSPEFTGSTLTHSPGMLGAFGYQYRTSPKKNIVFSIAGGMEYMHQIYAAGFGKQSFHRSWYQLPLLDEFRVYIAAEVGFGFRQKNRHW